MRFFRTYPLMPVPKAALFGSIGVVWGAPCAAGWMLAAVVMATKSFVPAAVQLNAYGLVYILIFSPVFSWIGWLLAAPLIWFMLRDGWFGWASAALVGLVVGAIASGLIGTAAALPFGIIALLALRWLLGHKLMLDPETSQKSKN